MKITKQILQSHGLTQEEYQRIVRLLGREPNWVELGMFSVLWSEHCSYKSSKFYLKQFPTKGPRVCQGPGENAGVVDIGDGLGVAVKIESHNHPSAIEPYQGAATGVGGIMRDIFTMGARPIAALNSLRFGPLSEAKNRFLFAGVVSGIGGYGNCLGVPTVAGEVYFDPCYRGNPLVNAMSVGLVNLKKLPSRKRKKNPQPLDALKETLGYLVKGIAAGPGNPVFYVGSATGRDGIHGATFASADLDRESEARRPAVQVGDPFTEKLLLEACLALSRTGAIVGMQDMGAAGLTSSSAEMAARAGTGIDMDLAKVPRREAGITPYELMLSESQERMLVVLARGREQEAVRLFQKWGLHAVEIGVVMKEPLLRIREGEEIVAEIPPHALVESAPLYQRKAKPPAYLAKVAKQYRDWLTKEKSRKKPPESDWYRQALFTLASDPTLASKQWVYRQYDHMVQTNTLVLPGAADAALLRIKGTNKILALTTDANSLYCYVDPQQGGAIAVAEAARNLACVGATPLAVTDCLNFGSPEDPEVFWQFREVMKGMSQACRTLDVPVVSGNVSFYNEHEAGGIYPTPVVGMVGLIEGEHYGTMAFRHAGDLIVLIGPHAQSLQGSYWVRAQEGLVTGPAPVLDFALEKRVQAACRAAIQADLLHSAHDCAEGGLLFAVLESCIVGERALGASLTLDHAAWYLPLWFGEDQSRIVVSLSPRKLDRLIALLASHEVPYALIGSVGGNHLEGWESGACRFSVPIHELARCYQESIPHWMERGA